jgi:maleate isomerase
MPPGRPTGEGRILASVALIVPSVNSVAEGDLARFLPPAVGWRVAGWETGKSHQRVEDILPGIADIAADVAAGGADIIGFGCTAASVVGGPDGSRRIAEAIGRRTGIPAVTTGAALAAAAGTLRLERILFCSPFDEDYDRPEIDGLRSFGVPIARSASLGLESAAQCAALTPGQIAGWVAELDHSGIDGVILSCANIRAFESVAALESLLGKPVVSSNQAIVWAMARRLGRSWRPARAGSLFDRERA